jgi:hypothetical protein
MLIDIFDTSTGTISRMMYFALAGFIAGEHVDEKIQVHFVLV